MGDVSLGREAMDESFLETVSLKTLLAPVEVDTFHSEYWERAPLFVSRHTPDAYGNLFTLADFDRAVSARTNTIRVAGGKEKDILKYDAEIVSPSLERILGDMRAGATLILDRLNEHHPRLDRLCRSLEAELSHRFRTDVFLTGPNSQAFIPHYDKNDFFVLQVLGSKTWQVEKSRRDLPESRLGFGPQNLALESDHDSFILHQGDLAYVPRGFVHTAQTGPEPSLHITLAMAVFTYSDLLRSLVDRAIADDEALRAALPLGFLRSHSDGLIPDLEAALTRMASTAQLQPAIESFKDDLVSKFPIDPKDQIEDFYRGRSLKKDDMVGPRRGIVWRMAANENSVTIRYGTRKIIFPAFLTECLEFALTEPGYRIENIPGDLQTSEKIVFVERLIDEGLVVRK